MRDKKDFRDEANNEHYLKNLKFKCDEYIQNIDKYRIGFRRYRIYEYLVSFHVVSDGGTETGKTEGR
jgi:hypothetical protein